MKLLIVESPNKITKLNSILGNGWEVVSTAGHIEDFPRSGIGVNIEDFSLRFEMKANYEKVVERIRERAAVAKEIFIATDPDREGEAIAHSVLKIIPSDKPAKRITFNALTDKAVLKAVHEPRPIDHNLVMAAHARKAIDRLIGYVLSPLASDALNDGVQQREKIYYSVGRVMSPTLGIVDDQTNAVYSFVPKEQYELDAVYDVFGSVGAASIWLKGKSKSTFKSELVAQAAAYAIGGKSHKIVSSSRTTRKVKPSAPLVTHSALMAAHGKYGMGAGATMNVLQKCFSGGALTYPRTDSPAVSPEMVAILKDAIQREYGQHYFAERRYQADDAFAQEAHECIRPTLNLDKPHWIYGDWEKIWTLARDRLIASMMADAIVEDIKYVIDVGGQQQFHAQGQRLVFDGFYRLTGAPEMREVPFLPEGTVITRCDVKPKKTVPQPPQPHNDATLVGEMVKEGLGRPGTRARVIEDLQERGYITLRGAVADVYARKEGKTHDTLQKVDGFESTEKGKRLLKYLDNKHPWVVDRKFTSEMEAMLDDVAKGRADYKQPIKRVWEKLQETVPELQGFSPSM